MAGDWSVQRLPDLLTLQRGHDLASDKRVGGTFPVIAATGQVGFHNEAKCDAPGVVIGRSGSIGGAQWIDEPFWPLNTTLYVIDFKGNNPYFCYSVLRSIDFQRFNAGSGVPTLNRNHLADIEVPSISRTEQDGIANLLVTLDVKIDLNRQMAATLEEMARALFKSWFVDFDAVHAKAEGRETGLSAEVAALFPDSFDDKGLPNGWTSKPLLSFADLISGGTPKTGNATYWNGSIPWASAKDVSQCGQLFLQATERSITELGLNESSTKIVPANSTVVVARGATTGRNCLFAIDMAMNQTCYALKSNEGFDFWLHLCFQNEITRIIASAHGSAFDTITTVTLQNANIVPASEGLRRAFEQHVSPLIHRILAATNEAQQLQNLRDFLLPKLLSGELRVADAESAIAVA